MTSDRPYREAMPSRVARLRLAQSVESQFDTTIVAAFEAVLAGADESYRLRRARSGLQPGSRALSASRRRLRSPRVGRHTQRSGGPRRNTEFLENVMDVEP